MKSHANLRNRIKGHRTVRAAELVPHELNWRTHPDAQRAALSALMDEVGFARSLLAYELPDGRLKLIDGHLRRDIAPDAMVTVEVLDVTDEEARKLLISIDPLAALAGKDDAVLAELRAAAETDDATLAAFWDAVARDAGPAEIAPPEDEEVADRPEQFLILVTCRSEEQQAELLESFHAEGLTCKPLVG